MFIIRLLIEERLIRAQYPENGGGWRWGSEGTGSQVSVEKAPNEDISSITAVQNIFCLSLRVLLPKSSDVGCLFDK